MYSLHRTLSNANIVYTQVNCVRCSMNIGFYFIKQEFFDSASNQLCWEDSITNKHMYFVFPLKHELWAVPLSSQYEKYKGWYDEAKAQHKKNRFLIFVNVMNRDGVLLIQNAFPISPEFIERKAYDEKNHHLTLPDSLIPFVEKRLNTMIIYEQKGILKFHADLHMIRNLLYKNSGKQ